MSSLEGLTVGTSVRGVLPDMLVTVVEINWYGSDALQLVSRRTACLRSAKRFQGYHCRSMSLLNCCR